MPSNSRCVRIENIYQSIMSSSDSRVFSNNGDRQKPFSRKDGESSGVDELREWIQHVQRMVMEAAVMMSA